MRAKARVEIHKHGSVRRMQIQDAAYALQAARESSHGQMVLNRDLVAER
jgi:hypothetical protein